MFKLFTSVDLSLRLKIYFGSFAAFIIVTSILLYFFSPSFAYASLDSVRFILSALVESEATVIAIVITLSLVVIQLTASSYSTRVIDIFKESPAIWIIVGTYITAILYGLTVLKFVDVIAASGIAYFETAVWIAYFLAIFAFGALIPYLLGSMDIMKSSTVINRFAERITKENILSGVTEYEKIVGRSATSLNYSYLYSDILRPVIEIDADPIQPIIDIIHSSMMKYDYETMRYGLKVLENYMIDIFKNEEYKKEDEIIAKHIFTHVERVGKLAASREDEDSVLEVVTTLFMMGNVAVDQKLENVIGESVNSIKNVGRSAIKRELEDVEMEITDLMAELGRQSAQGKLDFATTVTINSLGIIGRAAAKHAQQGLEETVWIAGTIQEIGKLAINYGLNQSVFHTINSLGEMGKYTARNDLPKTTIRIVDYLKVMGISTLEMNLYKNTDNAADYLWDIGRIAVWSELNILALRKLLENIRNSLKELKIKAQEKGFTKTASTIDLSLKRIEKLIKEEKVKDKLIDKRLNENY